MWRWHRSLTLQGLLARLLQPNRWLRAQPSCVSGIHRDRVVGPQSLAMSEGGP